MLAAAASGDDQGDETGDPGVALEDMEDAVAEKGDEDSDDGDNDNADG